MNLNMMKSYQRIINQESSTRNKILKLISAHLNAMEKLKRIKSMVNNIMGYGM